MKYARTYLYLTRGANTGPSRHIHMDSEVNTHTPGENGDMSEECLESTLGETGPERIRTLSHFHTVPHHGAVFASL